MHIKRNKYARFIVEDKVSGMKIKYLEGIYNKY